GLMGIMPISFTVAFIGSMSMAGIPLFGGFLSKELFLTSMLALRDFDLFNFASWGIVFPVLAWIASVFTFIYSFYFVFKTFAGKRKNKSLPVEKPREAPAGMLVAPIILSVLVIVIFFIPNIVGNILVKPAVAAMQTGLYSAPSDVSVHVSFWHGLTPELLMTLGIIALGTLLFLTLSKWQKIYDQQPAHLSLNGFYNALMTFGEKGMNKLSRLYMTGILRSYLIYIFASIVAITLVTLFIKDAFAVDMDSVTPITAYGILTAVLLVISVGMVVVAKTRMTAIIALGGVGYSVALFFVIFKAPDL